MAKVRYSRVDGHIIPPRNNGKPVILGEYICKNCGESVIMFQHYNRYQKELGLCKSCKLKELKQYQPSHCQRIIAKRGI